MPQYRRTAALQKGLHECPVSRERAVALQHTAVEAAHRLARVDARLDQLAVLPADALQRVLLLVGNAVSPFGQHGQVQRRRTRYGAVGRFIVLPAVAEIGDIPKPQRHKQALVALGGFPEKIAAQQPAAANGPAAVCRQAAEVACVMAAL